MHTCLVPDGLTSNPLTLFKGQTYRFSYKHPPSIAFVTKVSFTFALIQQTKQQIHHFYILQELQNMM